MAKPNLPKAPTPVETKPTTPSAPATPPATRPTTLGNTPVTSGTVTLDTPKNTAPDAEISPVKPGGTASTMGGKPSLPTLPNTGSTGGGTTGASNPIANTVSLNNGGLRGPSNFNPATDTGLFAGMVNVPTVTLPPSVQSGGDVSAGGGKPNLPTLPGENDAEYFQPTPQETPAPPTTSTQYQDWLKDNPTLPGTNANASSGKEIDLQEVTPKPVTPPPSNVSLGLPSNLTTPAAPTAPSGTISGNPNLPSLPTAPAAPVGPTGIGTVVVPQGALPEYQAPEIVLPGSEASQWATGVTLPDLQTSGFTPLTGQEFTMSDLPSAPNADAQTAAIREQLAKMQALANQQNAARVDHATQQAVDDLQRAQEDAQAMFKEQAESASIDERQGMDNASLYAQVRGDKGGIGMSQYNEIQAAAAQNRLAVQQQQTKLSTDTARQIADLRAKGEFEKADAALEVAQTYLAKLAQLEQWAAEYGMSAAQFNAQMAQWQNEFNMAMAQYRTDTEKWNAQMQYQQEQDRIANEKWAAQMQYQQEQDKLAFDKWNQQMQYQQAQDKMALDKWAAEFGYGQAQDDFNNALKQQNQLIDMGTALLSAGVMPSEQQLNAMGLSKEQAQAWIISAQLNAASKNNSANLGYSTTTDLYQALKNAGVTTAEEAKAALTMWGIDNPTNYTDAYMQWYRGNGGSSSGGTGQITSGMYTVLDSLNNRAGDGYKAEMIKFINAQNISDADKVKLAQAYGL